MRTHRDNIVLTLVCAFLFMVGIGAVNLVNHSEAPYRCQVGRVVQQDAREHSMLRSQGRVTIDHARLLSAATYDSAVTRFARVDSVWYARHDARLAIARRADDLTKCSEPARK